MTYEEQLIQDIELGVNAANKDNLKDHANIKAKWEAKRIAENIADELDQEEAKIDNGWQLTGR